MKFLMISVAVLLIHLALCAVQECEKKMMRTCAGEYKVAVRNGEKHCERLQTMIDCLARNPSCKDTTISCFRFWMLQMGKMDMMMDLCPNLNIAVINDLTTRFTNSNPLFQFTPARNITPPKCAKDIHINCVRGYLQTLKDTHQICTAVQALNDCYNQSANAVESTCDVEIIEHFVKILEVVAPKVIKVLKKNLPYVCNDWVDKKK